MSSSGPASASSGSSNISNITLRQRALAGVPLAPASRDGEDADGVDEAIPTGAGVGGVEAVEPAEPADPESEREHAADATAREEDRRSATRTPTGRILRTTPERAPLVCLGASASSLPRQNRSRLHVLHDQPIPLDGRADHLLDAIPGLLGGAELPDQHGRQRLADGSLRVLLQELRLELRLHGRLHAVLRIEEAVREVVDVHVERERDVGGAVRQAVRGRHQRRERDLDVHAREADVRATEDAGGVLADDCRRTRSRDRG